MLGPLGWTCTGLLAADGGRSLDAYPPGQSPSSFQIATQTPSDAQAVRVQIPAPHMVPAGALACPYFTTASGNGVVPCQIPAGEVVHRGGANFVEIEDPPGVAGLLTPSGGPYPANGVVIWDPATQYAAQAVCTLPEQQRQICTAVLNDFLDR